MTRSTPRPAPDSPPDGGSPQPFDAARLISDHQAGVWRYLRVLGCDSTLAEDLTQETFLRVLQRPFIEHSPQATSAYLRTVARNLYLSDRRRAGRQVAVEDAELCEEAWREWAGHDQGACLLSALDDCLRQLTERAREALRMRFGPGASREEIAGRLGIGEHGAKNLMQRAKQQLRTCIEGKLE